MRLQRSCKKALAVSLSAAMAMGLFSSVNIVEAQAEVTNETPNIAVVNFDAVWGDIDANVDKMVDYIEDAQEQDVDMLVFPEMAVNGYCYAGDLDDPQSKMAVETAETKDGETASEIAALADSYDMWITYGATEVVPGDEEHAYNSVFACSPEGEVTTYQKIHPVEGAWCEAGTTPVILDTDFGKVGVSICYDTYAVPELERYYVASGCSMFINPTATSRGSYVDGDSLNTTNWQWYYENRLESIVDRDGVYIASADLAGEEYNADGELLYNFPGGSVVIGPGGSSAAGKYVSYFAGGTDVQEPGMYVAEDVVMSSARGSDIRSSANFQPELYTEWYADLADDTAADMTAEATDSDPIIAAVNFQAVWGDLDANLEQMKQYIIDAAKQDTDIIVFPEMALQGYCSAYDASSEAYRLAVDKAITKKSYYTKELLEMAERYEMYVIFGASEKIPASENPDELDQAYNSAFCCTPDGEVYSYQKIQPVEGTWCMRGKNPVIVETEFGGLGLSICKDTYSYPELERYYAAKGCDILVNPTATSRGGASRWSWYYSRRLESIVDRDKLVVVSADLCGPQYDANGSVHSTFPGGSCVMAPLRSAVNGSYVDYVAGSSAYDPEGVGMQVGKVNLNSSKYSIGFSIAGFNPNLYAAMYGVLAGTTDVETITPAAAALVESADVKLSSDQEKTLAAAGKKMNYKSYTVETGLTTPIEGKSIYADLAAADISLTADADAKVYALTDGVLSQVTETSYADGKISFHGAGGTYLTVSYEDVQETATGYSFVKRGSKTYLYLDGKLVSGAQKRVTVNGKTYVVKKNGEIAVSAARKVMTVSGKKYMVNKDGTVEKPSARKLISASGQKYLVGTSGAIVQPSTRKLVKVGKSTYVLTTRGTIMTASGNKLVTVSGKKYIIKKSGAIYKNKKSVKVGKTTYRVGKSGIATKKK